jgi:hypothetical protein
MSVVGVLAGLLTRRRLLDSRPGPQTAAPARFALPTRSVLPIGLVGFSAIFVEGASSDWSGVYLRDVAGVSRGSARSAVAGWSVARRLVFGYGQGGLWSAAQGRVRRGGGGWSSSSPPFWLPRCWAGPTAVPRSPLAAPGGRS